MPDVTQSEVGVR